MVNQALIIGAKELDEIDLNLIKLLELSGIEYIHSSLHEIQSDNGIATDVKKIKIATFINIKSIHKYLLSRNIEDFIDLWKLLISKTLNILVYNISNTHDDISVIKLLSEGIIQSISCFRTDKNRYKINKNRRDICRQFAGLSFEAINNQTDFRFSLKRNEENVVNLIDINGEPFFIKIKVGKCNLFFLATNSILDISQNVTGLQNTRRFFSQLIPPFMFIKHVYKDHCWRSTRPQASLIIDDPLLKNQYGYLNYQKLLNEMDAHNFHTSIAFIPWNYKRTSENVAKMICNRKDRFSISVHGCDHLNNEFGTSDFIDLSHRMALASERMNKHEVSTGIKSDKVFIFPQGKFSINAMMVIKSNSYTAVVNSDSYPIDAQNQLALINFLEPAIMEYCDLPLFVRRYPLDILDFAFDLFFEKPVFIVIHHYDLKDGYKNLIDFIDKINSLDTEIKWDSLENVIKRSYLKRYVSINEIQIKMFSNTILIENSSNNTTNYLITKKQDNDASINIIQLNSKKIPWEIENSYLEFFIKVQSHHKTELKIRYRNIFKAKQKKVPMWINFVILLRRRVSELRDNYFFKNKMLLFLYIKLRKGNLEKH